MSRMQSILEKAERDGGVRRLRSVVVEPMAAAAVDVPPVRPETTVVDEAISGSAKVGRGRVITGAHLDPRLVAAASPAATAAEQYRALRTRILHADGGSALNVVLITSPGRGEGKTLTAANLALTMAQDFHRRVCIVDANFRHPQLHRTFGLTEGVGLSDVLTEQAPLEDALVALEEYSISILPAGTAAAHPAELLGSAAMRRTIGALRSYFDRIIIDAPSAVPLADVGIVTPLVDCVVLVVRAGATSRPAIAEAVGAIDQAKLLGVVLNETVES